MHDGMHTQQKLLTVVLPARPRQSAQTKELLPVPAPGSTAVLLLMQCLREANSQEQRERERERERERNLTGFGQPN